ncbi:hypothetical protein AB4383_18865 [Vibrio breoganii]
MNNKLILPAAAIIVGITLGMGAAKIFAPTLSGSYYTKTASIHPTQQGMLFIQPNIKVEFKSNQDYDLLYLTDKQIGFTSAGKYIVSPTHISLQESKHDKIVPDRELAFYEKVMISEGAILSNDSMQYLRLNDNEFMLVTEYGLNHYCKGSPCGDLERYQD